jgi:hypothetical protein
MSKVLTTTAAIIGLSLGPALAANYHDFHAWSHPKASALGFANCWITTANFLTPTGRCQRPSWIGSRRSTRGQAYPIPHVKVGGLRAARRARKDQ